MKQFYPQYGVLLTGRTPSALLPLHSPSHCRYSWAAQGTSQKCLRFLLGPCSLRLCFCLHPFTNTASLCPCRLTALLWLTLCSVPRPPRTLPHRKEMVILPCAVCSLGERPHPAGELFGLCGVAEFGDHAFSSVIYFSH